MFFLSVYTRVFRHTKKQEHPQRKRVLLFACGGSDYLPSIFFTSAATVAPL